jgi:hypothetical protein
LFMSKSACTYDINPALFSTRRQQRTLSFLLSRVGKENGGRWKALDEDDKAAFVAMAVEDKKRYEKEKKAYTPPAAVLD